MIQINELPAGSTEKASPPPPSSSALKLIPAWLIVCIPLGWGVYQTLHTSMALFNPPAPHAVQTPPGH